MILPVDYRALKPHERRPVREEYVRIQKGLCRHCGRPLTGPPREDIEQARITASLFPEGFFEHPIQLHHNHDTGMTIGAVHARCNAYLWEHKGE